MFNNILSIISSFLTILKNWLDPEQVKKRKLEAFNKQLESYELQLEKALAENDIESITQLAALMKDIRKQKEALTSND